MLREATIILPVNDNDGSPLRGVHAILERMLITAFGGFTAVQARGGWNGPIGPQFEPVIVYTVAGDATEANLVRFIEIARQICREARQECIYVRDFNGNVTIN